jgi:2-polyprenyl-6-methoxyphenol hydroxylase-like FAD-dependent oxidoreductase
MAPASKDGLDIIILGGGIAGLTTALALTKYAPKGQVPRIRIYEIRPVPATIGGAVNLTPNALRLLDDLGALPIIRERDYGREIDYLEVFDVYSTRLATSDFSGPDGKGIGNPPYKALRITRGDALKGVLAAVEAQENISMTCGKRTIDIKETPENVTLTFEDGESVSGDLLMGCDGIHSVTRLKHVDPERKASYSGLCNAFGFAPVEPDFPVHFECTAINFARRGMLLTSYHNSQKNSVYVGALMQLPELESRDGWKAAGADAKKIRADIMERFGDAKIPSIKPLIEKTEDFFLWPVFTLSKHGKWSTERVMLLGDAAVSSINPYQYITTATTDKQCKGKHSEANTILPARHAPSRRIHRHRLRRHRPLLPLPHALDRKGQAQHHERSLRRVRETAPLAHRSRFRGEQERCVDGQRCRLHRPHDQDVHYPVVPVVLAREQGEALCGGCY